MTYNNKQIGAWGEAIALEYLLNKGYALIEKNFQVKQGELDIIVSDPEGCMVIVEVKTDTTQNAGSPESWVTPKKIHQLNKVARIYVALHAREVQNIRFDVISVTYSRESPVIKHFENAFIPPASAY